MQTFLEKTGFSVDDIVRTDWTFINEVDSQQCAEITAVWEEFLADVAVKPATGTLRFVQRLGMADMMLEYEVMLAR